jgi:hypothetical protein
MVYSSRLANQNSIYIFISLIVKEWLEFLATDPKVRVQFPGLQDSLRSSGSGTGSLGLVSTIEELLGRKNNGFSIRRSRH